MINAAFWAQIADFVGIIGVILTLVAYCLLNIDKINAMSKTYLFLNLFGSCMLFYSLMFHWNLSSVLIEIAWITISLIGIVRYNRGRRNQAVGAK
jgi:hypothetical protein